jgi:hypothetical protein
LEAWRELDAAIHPKGAKSSAGLVGATAADVFLLTRQELTRTVLSDPGVKLEPCARQDIAAGAVDQRVLASLAFLSRSGLKPTVGSLRCGLQPSGSTPAQLGTGAAHAIDIVAVNGVKIAGNQGPGTIADLTIRTLLTLQGRFAPSRIVSLMRYPGIARTLASAKRWDKIEVEFAPVVSAPRLSIPTSARAAHAAGRGPNAHAPVIVSGELTAQQWSELIGRIGAIPSPAISRKPSKAAVRDSKAAAILSAAVRRPPRR